MRKLICSSLIALLTVTFTMGEAQAGATCKIVPSWCPPDRHGGGKGKVPEPATITLLVLGAAAAGFAARRRRD